MYVTREICATGMHYCSRCSFNSNMLNTTQEYIIKEINMNLQPPLAAGESWRKGEKKRLQTWKRGFWDSINALSQLMYHFSEQTLNMKID